MVRGIINLKDRRTFSYRISGHLDVEGKDDAARRLLFSSEGELPLGKGLA
jgi:hypothetical protein